MQIEYATKKELTQTQKNRLKRLERKAKEGFFGRFISWLDFTKSKRELTESDFAQYKSNYGKLSNKVYKKNLNGNFYLYRKFKNAVKAKKFMERL